MERSLESDKNSDEMGAIGKVLATVFVIAIFGTPLIALMLFVTKFLACLG